MKSLRFLIFTGIFTASCILCTGLGSPVSAKDELEVIRDKDKTTYSIGSDEERIREEERDKERAWQMLQNGNMWIDGRGRNPAPANR